MFPAFETACPKKRTTIGRTIWKLLRKLELGRKVSRRWSREKRMMPKKAVEQLGVY